MIHCRHVEQMETESWALFATYLRQVVTFSRPGATISSVRLFPAVVFAVLFGESLVSLGCWQSQPSSTLPSCGKSQIVLLSRRPFEIRVLGTTDD